MLCCQCTQRPHLSGTQIVDYIVNAYQPKLPKLLDAALDALSAQLVPLDGLLAKALGISGVLFTAWFFVQVLTRAIVAGSIGAVPTGHA
jgi:hypothetical protein